jgi:uncharacterized damage-inducible protein DinB
MKDTLLAEFDHEMAVTRRVLDRVPEAAFGWKPHERSYSLGELASHLAQLPHWGTQILEQPGYDLAAATGHRQAAATRAEVLAAFDRHAAEVRGALVSQTDAGLASPWLLKRDTHTLLSMPRSLAMRTFFLHHVIHHRGQLTVYLRLQNVPVPPIYGPSADEPM